MSHPSAPQFCAFCGAALLPQAKFCPACGKQQLGYGDAKATVLLSNNTLLHRRYLIQKRLGEGGFGAVYQAEDAQFKNAKRAIKEMIQDGMSEKERQEAAAGFEQEAMLLAGLKHPHLPSIYDHFEEDARWYLVMDFIDGKTLEARLEQISGGKLPMETVLDIGIKLCNVLGYLHTRHPPIIFRDLKPANVMITPEDDLYLIDFGIARLFKSGQTKDTVAFGSHGYAAPEQFGKSQTTAQSDIYSLGALLHQLLSGVDPSTNQPLLWDFKPLSPALPASLTQLITRMVNVRTEQRPASMQEVKQELQRIAGLQAAGSGTLAPTYAPFTQPSTPLPPPPLAPGAYPAAPYPSSASPLAPGAYPTAPYPSSASSLPPGAYPAAPYASPPSSPPTLAQPAASAPLAEPPKPKVLPPPKDKYHGFRRDTLFATAFGVGNAELFLLGGVGTLVGVFTQSWPWAVGTAVALALLAYALGYRKALPLIPLSILAVVSIALVYLITASLASNQYDHGQTSQFLFFGKQELILRHQIIAGACVGAIISLSGFSVFDSKNPNVKNNNSFEINLYAIALLFGVGGGGIIWLIVTLLGSIFDWGFGFGYGLLFNFLYGYIVTALAGIGVICLLYIWIRARGSNPLV